MLFVYLRVIQNELIDLIRVKSYGCVAQVHVLLLIIVWLSTSLRKFLAFLWFQVHDNERTFVLEIGTEEMPPQDVVDASKQV